MISIISHELHTVSIQGTGRGVTSYTVQLSQLQQLIEYLYNIYLYKKTLCWLRTPIAYDVTYIHSWKKGNYLFLFIFLFFLQTLCQQLSIANRQSCDVRYITNNVKKSTHYPLTVVSWLQYIFFFFLTDLQLNWFPHCEDVSKGKEEMVLFFWFANALLDQSLDSCYGELWIHLIHILLHSLQYHHYKIKADNIPQKADMASFESDVTLSGI